MFNKWLVLETSMFKRNKELEVSGEAGHITRAACMNILIQGLSEKIRSAYHLAESKE